MGLMAVPNVMANKENAVGQDAFEGDLSTPEGIEEMMKKFKEKYKIVFEKQPEIKTVLHGICIEMLEHGYIEMDV